MTPHTRPPGVRAPRKRAHVFGCLMSLVLLAACSPDEEQPARSTNSGASEAEVGNFTARIYERNVVFASAVGDSAFFVPWMIQTVERPDTMERQAEGWLARGGVWDGFFSERWGGPVLRSPARILPYGGLQLLIGDGDVIDGVVFEDSGRSLEVFLDEVASSWAGPRGERFEVLTGSAYLADQRIDGMVLDMARTSIDVPQGGDWAFLLSGDSAHFVVAASDEHSGETAPDYRAWGAWGEEATWRWPTVEVDWARNEAYPPARRDVPVAWHLTTEDQSLEGTLEAESAEIVAGEGPGPLLPVRALYEVRGNLRTDEGDFPVYGFMVHQRR